MHTDSLSCSRLVKVKDYPIGSLLNFSIICQRRKVFLGVENLAVKFSQDKVNFQEKSRPES